jgi:RNA polymerase sigma-70 factor (ECF subfamily)
LCRPYLLLIANQELQPDLQGKVNPSDLVQETFVKAQENFAQFRGHTEEELRGWLRRILLNTLANTARHYRDTASWQVGREVPLEAASPAEAAQAPDAGLIAGEQNEALYRALESLPEHYRRVLRLRHWERQSFEEIGATIGRSPEAARKLWVRAVEQLRQILGPRDGSR